MQNVSKDRKKEEPKMRINKRSQSKLADLPVGFVELSEKEMSAVQGGAIGTVQLAPIGAASGVQLAPIGAASPIFYPWV